MLLHCRVALQHAHWQAHDGSVSSLDMVSPRPATASSSGSAGAAAGTAASSGGGTSTSSSGGGVPLLIVSGSRDANVAVWTAQGGLVGMLGEHAWDLEHPGSWQDPQGVRRRQPKPADGGMFLKVCV